MAPARIDNQSAAWSLKEAAVFTWETILGDLGGFARQRKELLQKPYITEKEAVVAGRHSTWLTAQQADNLPSVLFIHGTPGNALEWAWYLENAADKFVIHAVDRPGFGPSDRATPSLVGDMQVLQAILREIGRKVIIVGHSLGGGIAARLALDCPELVRHVVFLGSSLDPSLERVLPIQRLFAQPFFSACLTPSVRNSNRELIQYIPFLEELAPRLHDLRCPVTIMHARDDALVPFANVDYIRRQCVNAVSVNVIALESGGHFLHKTRRREFMNVLGTIATGF